MQARSSLSAAAVVCMLSAGSASCVSATYAPPSPAEQPASYQRVVDASFDDTWEDLIQYAAGTFFGIENFEKESGLITLSFGAAQPSDFVDGGYWTYKAQNASGTLTFNGEYVDYLTLHQNGELRAAMNIVVASLSETQTLVTVNTKYVFTASIVNPQTGVRKYESGHPMATSA